MKPRPVIVIADDVSEICNLVAKFLEPFGYHVVSAKSGRDALQVVQSTACALLVTDVLMPDGDGIDLISELKRTCSLPVLAISGGGGPGLEPDQCCARARSAGADVTLKKPFDRKQLLAAVTAALGG